MIKPKFLRYLLLFLIELPRKKIFPSQDVINPARIFIRVDFPLPLGPNMAKTDLLGISKLTSLRAIRLL